MKPKLYQYAACPFCSKVTSMLAYKKVDYDIIEVNPMNRKEIAFSEGYQKVPIYIDTNGQQVNESNDILKRIDEEYPTPSVFSRDASQSEKEAKWISWSEKFVKGLPTVIYDTLPESVRSFDYITKTGNFGWIQSRLIQFFGAFVMTLVAKKIRKRENIENPEAFVESMTQEWIAGIEGGKFMGGDSPNGADIAVFGISRAVGSLRAGDIFKKNRAFWAWLENMQEATGLTLSVV